MGSKLQMEYKKLTPAQQMRRIKQYCKEGIIKVDDIVECGDKFLLFKGIEGSKVLLEEVGRESIKERAKPSFRDGFDMEAAIQRVQE